MTRFGFWTGAGEMFIIKENCFITDGPQSISGVSIPALNTSQSQVCKEGQQMEVQKPVQQSKAGCHLTSSQTASPDNTAAISKPGQDECLIQLVPSQQGMFPNYGTAGKLASTLSEQWLQQNRMYLTPQQQAQYQQQYQQYLQYTQQQQQIRVNNVQQQAGQHTNSQQQQYLQMQQQLLQQQLQQQQSHIYPAQQQQKPAQQQPAQQMSQQFQVTHAGPQQNPSVNANTQAGLHPYPIENTYLLGPQAAYDQDGQLQQAQKLQDTKVCVCVM